MTEYYWLKQDTRNKNIQASLPESLVNMQSKISGDVSYLPRLSHTTFRDNVNSNMEYDILDMGLFLVTDKVKKVFHTVFPNMDYRTFCITSDKSEDALYYHALMIAMSDIRAERITPPNTNGKQTIKLILDEPIDADIFKVSVHSDKYVIVSQLVAQQLMKIKAQNIMLIPIKVSLEK